MDNAKEIPPLKGENCKKTSKTKSFIIKYRGVIMSLLAILVIITVVYSWFYDIPRAKRTVVCEQHFLANAEMAKLCVMQHCNDYFIEDYIEALEKKKEKGMFTGEELVETIQQAQEKDPRDAFK